MTLNPEHDAALPPGKTCADCRHAKRCTWLISVDLTNTPCDWIPSRFLQVRKDDTEPAP